MTSMIGRYATLTKVVRTKCTEFTSKAILC
jgi:hypothetical protein